MCDSSAVRNWFLAIAAMIIVAGVIVLVAIGFNTSVIKAEQATAFMVAAFFAIGIPILFCTFARSALTTYCACAAAFPACKSACSSVGALLTAVQTVLGIQATACLTAALVAWIPFVGTGPMLVIFGAMISEVGLLIGGIALLLQLSSCQGPSKG
jgi:hypothetical protein